MSYLRNAVALATACACLAAPMALATSTPSFAKHKKHHGAMTTSPVKTPPASQMKTTSPESKQTPSGGQPGGPAGKS